MEKRFCGNLLRQPAMWGRHECVHVGSTASPPWRVPRRPPGWRMGTSAPQPSSRATLHVGSTASPPWRVPVDLRAGGWGHPPHITPSSRATLHVGSTASPPWRVPRRPPGWRMGTSAPQPSSRATLHVGRSSSTACPGQARSMTVISPWYGHSSARLTRPARTGFSRTYAHFSR